MKYAEYFLNAFRNRELTTGADDFVPWIQRQYWDPKNDDIFEMLVET